LQDVLRDAGFSQRLRPNGRRGQNFVRLSGRIFVQQRLVMIPVYNHLALNPKMWLADNVLRPAAAELSTRIFISFMTVLSTYGGLGLDLDADVKDVVLCGSCVGYNYKRKSDVDISIILRPDRYLQSMDSDTLDTLLDFVGLFFIKKYDPKILGMRVDISVVPDVSGRFARYSLIQKKWLKEPRRFSADETQRIKYRADLYYRALRRRAVALLRDKNMHGQGCKTWHEMKLRRSESWDEDLLNMAPYSLAYSHLNRQGYVQRLSNADRNNIRRLILNARAGA
jgi:predicted nucleotidyltransferase